MLSAVFWGEVNDKFITINTNSNIVFTDYEILKGIIPVYIFYQYYPGLSYVENHMSIYFEKATLISP